LRTVPDNSTARRLVSTLISQRAHDRLCVEFPIRATALLVSSGHCPALSGDQSGTCKLTCATNASGKPRTSAKLMFTAASMLGWTHHSPAARR
jgi:hypothetical protein